MRHRTAVVEVEGLQKRYADVVAVDDVSFEVGPGEVFGLLGPNGAGKTTTVEILEGFRRPDAGRISVLGLDPVRMPRELAPRIGVMPQDGGLWAGIRPPEALRLFARLYDDPEDPEVLLERLGLAGARNTPFRRLSGGERQRLSLALALVGRPDLAFLDEPTTGMDPHGRSVVWEIVGELRSKGSTVILTTHLLDEAERVADRIAILNRGRLVATGSPEQLAASASAEVRFRAPPGLDVTGLAGELGSPVAEERSGHYRLVDVAPSPELVARLAAALASRGVLVRDITVGHRTLEEVFLELTTEGEGAR